jgi:ABC-2 type transport system permease protein
MDTIISKVMAQNMILPIVVFVLIMMTSQMLISAISNEKIDKTLETLLSAPVSRTAVIGAKMLAAAVVAFINAVIYMVGFTLVFSGMTSSVDSETTVSSTSALIGEAISSEVAMHQLGLTISPVDYLLIGVQLFLTIMICLSVSIILGAMANDTKSSQNMILPILMLAMIPYIISMITDINALPTVFRIIVYAIPFTHTFSAMSNIMFGNTALFYGGIVYQAVVFALCMFFALRLFKSDKLFTSSLNLGQKSKFKKK